MTKINSLKKSIYIFIGFAIIMYIIYIRIFFFKVPRDLYINFQEDTDYIKVLFLGFSIFLCLFTLITNIKLLYNISKKNTWLYLKLEQMSTIIDESLKQALSLIMSLLKIIMIYYQIF